MLTLPNTDNLASHTSSTRGMSQTDSVFGRNGVRRAAVRGIMSVAEVGISRAVRVGPIITVVGTAPLGPDGRTVGRGDAPLSCSVLEFRDVVPNG